MFSFFFFFVFFFVLVIGKVLLSELSDTRTSLVIHRDTMGSDMIKYRKVSEESHRHPTVKD